MGTYTAFVRGFTDSEIRDTMFLHFDGQTHFFYRLNVWELNLTYNIHHTKLQIHLEDYMKKKSIVQSTTDTSALPFGGYINIKLTDAELSAHDSWVSMGVEQNEFIEGIQMIVADGKLTVQCKNGSFSATTTRAYEGKLLALSAFSGDLIECITLLMYKVSLRPEWYKSDVFDNKSSRG